MNILLPTPVLIFIAILLSSTLGISLKSVEGKESSRSMLGGYQKASITDESVVEAATFAVNALPALFAETPDKYTFATTFPVFEQGTAPSSKLSILVLEASQQVVAGMNFDVKIGVFEGENLLGAFSALIYDHFGDLSVTTWGTELSSEDVILLKEKNSE